MGAVDAFVLGAVAHFFMDRDHPSRIVPWLRLIGTSITFIGVGIYAYQFFGSSLVTIVPPILAAITISILCPHFVNYAVRVQQGDPRPVSKGIIIW